MILTTNFGDTIARGSMRVTVIGNQNVAATPSLYVRDATVDASAGSVSVPVLMGGMVGERSASTVTVDYTTVDGSAVAGTDYGTTASTLSFAPGETVKNIVVPLTDGAAARPATRFTVVLSDPSNATIADATGVVVIGAHGAGAVSTPRVSLGPDMVVGEGDGYVDVPVTVAAPGVSVATVQFNTLNGTAKGNTVGGPGIDYLCPVSGCNNGTLTFAPGETTKTIRVPLENDPDNTSERSFTVILTTNFGDTITRGSMRVTVIGNQNVAATPSLYVRDATVDASAGSVSVPVLMGGMVGERSASTVTVDYTTVDGSAVAGTDYGTTASTLSFAPGETVKNIVVPLTDGAAARPATRFTVVLSDPSNATIADATGVVVIGAHGAGAVSTPRVSLGPDMVVGEGDGYVDVPVTVAAPGVSVATVQFNTLNGTAKGNTVGGPGIDYLCPVSGCNNGTLTFAPGETTKTIRVPLENDPDNTSERSFTVILTTNFGDTIARGSATITINGNKNAGAPASTVSASPAVVLSNGVMPSTVMVTLKDASAKPVSGRIVTLAKNAGSSSVISPASGPSDGNGHVTFVVTDGTPESVTYTATDTTDSVTVTQTASVSFVIDTTAPTVTTSSPSGAVNLSTSIPLKWAGHDNVGGVGVAHYDIQAMSAAWNGSFGPWSNWKMNTTATETTFPGAYGRSYCFRVRAVDRAANTSGWSQRCTSVPLKSSSLAYSSGWSTSTSSAYFGGSAHVTKNRGAHVTRTSVKARHIWLVVTRCSTCGAVQVRWNNVVKATINLASATTKHRQVVAAVSLPSVQSGTLSLYVTTTNRAVIIEGVDIYRG